MGLVVKAADARLCGYCVRGAMKAVAEVGFDSRSFFRDGIPIEEFEAVDDDQFKRLAAAVREANGQEKA